MGERKPTIEDTRKAMTKHPFDTSEYLHLDEPNTPTGASAAVTDKMVESGIAAAKEARDALPFYGAITNAKEVDRIMVRAALKAALAASPSPPASVVTVPHNFAEIVLDWWEECYRRGHASSWDAGELRDRLLAAAPSPAQPHDDGVIRLNDEDWADFVATIENPPAPTDKMREAVRLHAEWCAKQKQPAQPRDLEGENKMLRELIKLKDDALEPFAKEGPIWADEDQDDEKILIGSNLTVGDLRRAKSARDATATGETG